MHSYREGYWGPRNLPRAKPRRRRNRRRGTSQKPIRFGFHHENLTSVHIDIPIASANREARSIALNWVRKHGFRVHYDENRECFVFVHRFDPERDALFVATEQWHTFCNEAHNRLAKPDLAGFVVSNTTEITQIAVPHVTIWRDNTGLADIFHWYPRLRAIYIVWDIEMNIARETMLAKGDRNKARARLRNQRWTVKDLRSKSLVWDREEKRFGWRGQGVVCEFASSELYAQMEEMGAELAQRLAEREDGEFEIRPIYAAKG
ncbi:hypothetical protein TgHK011_004547 [Trichoderma gracile]|nr:hypothetical protein TgHK011_004547 [Trichoderma gracile]